MSSTINKIYQDKLSLYELEIKKLTDMHDNDIKEIKNLRNRLVKQILEKQQYELDEENNCCI